MKGNELACFAITMREEGGAEWSRTRADPGNWTGNKVGIGKLLGTKWGVSAPVAARHGLVPETLTEQQALTVFYLPEYWDAVWADVLPLGVDLVVTDDAYNAGPANANKLFKKVALGSSIDDQISRFSALRLSFLQGLKTWKTFGRGWGVRVARVEADAHRMAKTPVARVEAHAATAQAASAKAVKTAVAAPVVAAGASAGAVQQQAVAGLPPSIAIAILAAIAVVVAVAVAITVWKARGQAQRAEALSALAKEITP